MGSYSIASSYYGTYDQGGNVWELNEMLIGEIARGMHGGSWFNYGQSLNPKSGIGIGKMS